MKSNIIESKNPVILHNTYVKCLCGEEIAEFQLIGEDENNFIFHINMHGWYSRLRERWSDFTFSSSITFMMFLSHLLKFLHNGKDEENVFECVDYNGKGVLSVIFEEDKSLLSISKLKTAKSKKATWEIVLNKKEVEELYQELRSWMMSEENN